MARHAGLIFACALTTAAAAQAQVQPGQWETVVTVKSVEVPGAPPQMAEMMRQRMGGAPARSRYCLTPAQAAKGPQEMLKQNPSCKFTKYTMTGGVIATEMSCAQGGGTMTARANGSYTANSFSVTSSVVMTGNMSMRMTSTNTGRRLGPCVGK